MRPGVALKLTEVTESPIADFEFEAENSDILEDHGMDFEGVRYVAETQSLFMYSSKQVNSFMLFQKFLNNLCIYLTAV